MTLGRERDQRTQLPAKVTKVKHGPGPLQGHLLLEQLDSSCQLPALRPQAASAATPRHQSSECLPWLLPVPWPCRLLSSFCCPFGPPSHDLHHRPVGGPNSLLHLSRVSSRTARLFSVRPKAASALRLREASVAYAMTRGWVQRPCSSVQPKCV